MDHRQETSNKREMPGCAREAAYESKAGDHRKAAEWNQKAAERLVKLNGMASNW